ncbi:16S rRNA (cytosine(1402)-N(4))-methyltransferase RsmH [Sphingomonas lacunae]|uniref:Ribosomal RNA small subunit methyltransferase H n=1 Tax=Sphingomonas lacunae TaxID=2698828 RepID=A0A6M4AY66_9SPHN|nr:16S rRNA (cytosine(1402)-N(4))-methyltransferase RsmH [Sphingomonas lacunae]QJQ33310.1 16S rRNA (cytosine(1402)-N(4))-methyltransferase RsmH [Sphingomonas lacunae]
MSAVVAPSASRHIPVLRDEVVAALAPSRGQVIVDGTFGAGGYSRAILDSGADVIAIDRDPDAIADGQAMVAEFDGRLTLVAGTFSELDRHAALAGHARVDGVTLDIGVSSMQLDQARRGFAFSLDGPLDMRMQQEGETAAEWIDRASESEIADTLYLYGEERQSRRVARAIVAARPISRTGELAAVVRKALGYRPGAPKDPATRSFQAIRIVVNDELGELERGLEAAERVLAPGGRLAVVSFQSLEDRIVKQFLRQRSGGLGSGSRHLPPQAAAGPAPTFVNIGKAVRPAEAELARNPRARSATLRTAIRTSAPAWSTGSAVGDRP